jgi:hypothetical protein
LDSKSRPTNPKTVLRTGLQSGLSLELFVGIPNKLEPVAQTLGLVLFIHTNKSSPLSAQPITILPNTETNIGITKTQTSKQPKPFSNCQDLNSVTSDLIDAILKNV